MAEYRCVVADFKDAAQAAAVVSLLSGYSEDKEFGAGAPFSAEHQAELSKQLGSIPNAFSVLAYRGTTPCGVATCFGGFSTWACKPLVNVHDIFVAATDRKKGVCTMMLQKVDEVAKARGCCKLTLEVLPTNEFAKGAYGKHGFGPYEINGETLLVYKKMLL